MFTTQMIKRLGLGALIVLLCAVPVLAHVPPRTAIAQISGGVLPFSGTPDASPRTDIDFLGAVPASVHGVVVTGSRSGTHQGSLRPLPGGRGTAFVSARPFIDDERVTVRALVGGRPVGSAFGVQTPLPNPPMPAVRHDILDTSTGTYVFHSEPSLHPPIVYTSGTDPDPSEGDIFADSEDSIQAGPVILDPNGQLLYFGGLHQAAAFNTEVQTYQGQSVLTYWQGYVVPPGYGIGKGMILDHAYQTVATVKAGNGLSVDLHEFQLTPQGTALVTAYAKVKADLTPVGGPRNGTLLDSIIQEINIATGKVVWEWHAYGHVHLSETYAGRPGSGPYDFFHINSIQQLPNGNLLVSARHMWAVYEINKQTGKLPVVIGGKHSSFQMGPGTNFEWQHDAHLNGSTLTVFDNASGIGYTSERQSRALRINLNFSSHRATLANSYTDNPSVLATSQGSVEDLADGNTFVGWGQKPYFSEYGPDGAQIFSLHFGSPKQSYRGYRFQWYGQPTTPPAIAVSNRHSGGAAAWASWNGDTEVAYWQVLAGTDPTSLQPVGEGDKNGFETEIPTSNPGPYYAVQAYSQTGQLLATSATVQPTFTSP